jgi:adenylate kinase family enzyme
MNDIKINLKVLIESLERKIIALKEIAYYTKKQEDLLRAEELDFRAFKNIMKNKQVRIDKISQLDEGFKPAYERIQGALNSQKDLYREEIEQMKTLVKEIGELSVAVQVLEGRNKQKFDMKASMVKSKMKDFRQSKQVVASYYDNIKKQKKADQSYFFDTKK